MTDSTQSNAVASAARNQLLAELGLSPATFEAFLKEPYQAVMEAIGAAVRGDPAHEFMGRPQMSVPELEAIVSDTATAHQLAARRLIVDRIMALYLLRAFATMTDQEFDTRLEIVGLERLNEAVAAGRGVILLNSHFGPGRLVPIILARLGWDLGHVSPINEVAILDLNLPGKIDHIALGPEFDLRVLATMRARLLEGRIVHGTGDGMRGNAFVARPFLGKPRRFPQSFGFLSLSTGAPCLPVFVRSDEFGAIRLEICPALKAGDPSSPAETRISGMIDGYSAELEKRWLTDYGNVPPHSLQLYQRGFPGLSRRKG